MLAEGKMRAKLYFRKKRQIVAWFSLQWVVEEG